MAIKTLNGTSYQPLENFREIWSLLTRFFCKIAKIKKYGGQPGFDSQTWRHMWVEFVVGSGSCSEYFYPGSPVLLPSSHTQLKFQLGLDERIFYNEFFELFRVTWVNRLHLHFFTFRNEIGT